MQPPVTHGEPTTRNGSAPGAIPADVAVVGLGYAGLTMAIKLAETGVVVLGCDADAEVVDQLSRREAPFFERGIDERLAGLDANRFRVSQTLPDTLPPTIVIAVGTPLDARLQTPNLSAVTAVLKEIAARADDDTLVILRSTLPVGASRRLAVGMLAGRIAEPLVAFCPERTSQGAAMDELPRLPQVVGASTEEAARRAEELFSHFAPRSVRMSSLEAAELVKLVNNAHTDLLYAFGNEVGRIAEVLGLDAAEVIAGANADYPRPHIARPGPVGGSCLTKDPLLLMHSAAEAGYLPPLIATAREINKAVVDRVAATVIAALADVHGDPRNCDVLLCGIAFKGLPETDDIRSTPAAAVGERLRPYVRSLRAHDPVVGAAAIEELGFTACELPAGASGAHAVVVLTEHPAYAGNTLGQAVSCMVRRPVVYDVWGVGTSAIQAAEQDVVHLRLGRA